jgi:L-histidine Nalpha-methyltransferase
MTDASIAFTALTGASDGAAARRARILREVHEGLSKTPKELPSKYFYDERGSELFEEITRLPEYYLTRAEREILVAHVPSLVETLRSRTLVELGAGSAAKTRVVLDAMRDAGWLDAYVPVDVSEEFLAETASRVRGEYPGLRVLPVAADLEASLDVGGTLRHPMLVAFLGSTIGNFDDRQAEALLRRVGALLGPFDRLLLGADLRKDTETLTRAYNDASGVTAAFNRNILWALNGALDADFRPAEYAHRAFYDERLHRIEMHLVARREQCVHIDGMHPVVIGAGEPIRTEISCKYDEAAIARLCANAGLDLEQWMTDAEGRFALALIRGVRQS